MRPLVVLALLTSACAGPETDDAAGVSQGATVTAISRGSTWRHWDRGGDLGTAWRGSYDDASWPSGAGPLGYGESYVVTTVSDAPITNYFRRRFTVADPAAVVAIHAEVMFDDGFVAYLNGVEVARAAMPTGPITTDTLSSGHEIGNAYETYDWSAFRGALVAGENVLAVEVHQASASSSDLTFDAALTLETGAPPSPPSSELPRGSSWYYWDAGGDLGTGWRTLSGAQAGWDLGAGPLGFGESYVVTTIPGRHITTYFRASFTVDDPAAVTAMMAEVMFDDGFVAYLNGTEVARAAMPGGAITATTLSSGHEIGNAYERYDWSAFRGALVAGENVLAVEVHQASATSSDLTFDLALALEVDEEEVELDDGIPRASSWHLRDDDVPQGTDWRRIDFQMPPEWRFGGAGPFGFGEPYINEPVEPGASTTYFRRSFLVTEPSMVTRMLAEVMYDDGFVAYLNGVEIARGAMPAGPIGHTTASTGHEAENRYESFDVSAFLGALRAGWNLLAVEVHQVSASSSDLVFDLGLRLFGRASDPPPPDDNGEDIPRGSTWTYWDGPSEPAAYKQWTDREYDDTNWDQGAGPLGYGDGAVATTISYGGDPTRKHITAYFRRYFTVDAPTVQTRLIADLLYDDGVVVYLNGHEIARHSMPSGIVVHETLAFGHEGDYERFDWSAYSGYLLPGPNVIAVEVHQAAPSSSDLVFDLALQVEVPEPCGIAGGGPPSTPLPQEGLTDVWVGPTATWVTGGDGHIGRRGADGRWCWAAPIDGEGWSVSWSGVWGSADDDVWFIGFSAFETLLVHHDGASFTRFDVDPDVFPEDIWGSSPNDVWVVGGHHVLHFDGSTWQWRSLTDATVDLAAVWGASADQVWIGGSEPFVVPDDPERNGSTAVIYRWDAGSATWVRELSDTVESGAASVRSIHGAKPTDIWAVGGHLPRGGCGSHVLHYDGAAWSHVVLPDEEIRCRGGFQDVRAGAPGAETGIWVGLFNENHLPGALRYVDGTWSVADPITSDLVDIDHRGDQMFAVGGETLFGGHKILRWDGAAWVRDW